MTTLISTLIVSVAMAQEASVPALPISGTPLTVDKLIQMINQVAGFLISVAPVIAVIFIIWGGITYMAAGSDEEKVGRAKARIKNAIIGVIIVFGVGMILSTLSGFIGTLTLYKP